ncbi:MAG: hypothetical protein R3A52_08005 [Polyangiales bacterium]
MPPRSLPSGVVKLRGIAGSMSATLPSAPRITCPGRRSRWSTPALWSSPRAEQSRAPSHATSGAESLPRDAMRSWRVSPETNSRATQVTSPASPNSSTLERLGWRICESFWSSRRTRWRSVGEVKAEASTAFTITVRPVSGSRPS